MTRYSLFTLCIDGQHGVTCDGSVHAVVRLFVHICVPGPHVHGVVSFCNCMHTVMPQHADLVNYVSICHDASVPTSPVNALSVDLPVL